MLGARAWERLMDANVQPTILNILSHGYMLEKAVAEVGQGASAGLWRRLPARG